MATERVGEGMATVTLVSLLMVGLGFFLNRRQHAKIESLQSELSEAKLAIEAQAEAALQSEETLRTKLEKELQNLDRECDRLAIENRLHKQYAHVCRECKTHDPQVRAEVERNLRSVTGGPNKPFKR